MARSPLVSHTLWSLVGGLAACGRLGFEDGTGDAEVQVDANEGTPVAVVSPTFGITSICGEASAGHALTVENTGSGALVINGASFEGAGFSVETPLPLTIAPGSSATLGVVGPAAVIGTDLPGDEKTAVLTLATNAGPLTVDVTSVVHGALVSITDIAGDPLDPTFTSSSANCPTQRTVLLRNEGDLPTTISVGDLSAFTVSGFTTLQLDAGASGLHPLRVLTTSSCTGGDVLKYTATSSCSGSFTLDLSFSIASTACFCS